ncbi:sporulation protein Cse60 [bacterium c-19]|nr:sporulation protein Cse60 [bacterium c-19]
MLQVKVFDEAHEDDLSEAINTYLGDHPDIELFDIKYAAAIGVDKEEQLYCFSAMLIYRDKAA